MSVVSSLGSSVILDGPVLEEAILFTLVVGTERNYPKVRIPFQRGSFRYHSAVQSN